MAQFTTWSVTLMGEDVSADVERIDNVSTSLDVPDLTEYVVSDVRVTLFNNRNDYSPDKSSNFFTDRMGTANGFNAEIVIEAGFSEDGTDSRMPVFSGRVVEVSHDVTPNSIQLVAVDRRIELQNNPITDFGLEKNNEIQRVARSGPRGHHIFGEQVIPVSAESVREVQLDTGQGTSTMMERQFLRDEGQLMPTNYLVDDAGEGIETEALTGENATINATYKAPYRGISIKRAIERILDKHDIEIRQNSINIEPIRLGEAIWNSHGRVGYELESIRSETGAGRLQRNDYPFEWRGHVTDYVCDARNPDARVFYFLYSHKDQDTIPVLFKYEEESDSWSRVQNAPNHQEWWQLAASSDFQTFFILRTNSTFEAGLPKLGTYNPALGARPEDRVDTSCLRVDTSTDPPTLTSMLETVDLRPQLSMNYWYGFRNTLPRGLKTNPLYGFLPDTRTGFQISGNALYYRYASDRQFGLARSRLTGGTAESVIAITRDNFHNHASFDFVIDTTASPNVIYASHTNMARVNTELQSRLLVYKRDVPSNF